MIFKIHVDIYKTDVHVIIDETDEASMKYLKKVAGSDTEFIIMRSQAEAVTVRHECGLCFVRLRKDYLISTVAHEMLHCVFYILNGKGMEYNDGSEEAYTYLLEYLMYCFDKKTKNKNHEI